MTGAAPTGSGAWGSRLRLAGAAAFGAAVVVVIWVVFGGGGNSSVASFQVSPGIPPVVFLYLDNVRIASFLAQLQGGAATSESLSRQATQTRNASVGASGVSAGGSASQESTAQLSLTVTNQSRFIDLLGLLQSDNFLQTIDMGAANAVVTRQFAPVKPGTFVKLTDCQLALPSYVQAEQAWRAAKGRLNVEDVFLGLTNSQLEFATAYQALNDRSIAQSSHGIGFVDQPPVTADLTPQQSARAATQMDHLVARVGPDPRVPLTSCRGGGYDPSVPDLLMPIRLGGLASSPAALAGHVTVVGKVMLEVHGTLSPGSGTTNYGSYVDLASLQQWAGAPMWTSGDGEHGNRKLGTPGAALADDATVTGPGFVIQPIAIYK